jgi:hypothetical protein
MRVFVQALITLLNRLVQLIPQPIPAWKRFSYLFWKNRGAILAALVAIWAIWLLVRQSEQMDQQLERQYQISQDIQRTLQPIEDLRVSAFVDFDSTIPGLSDYLKFLSDTLLISENGDLRPKLPLPRGVSISIGSPEGIIEEITIRKDSGLWPEDEGEPWFRNIIEFVELSFEFYLEGDVKKFVESSSIEADLQFEVGSFDPDGSDEDDVFRHTLQWNIEEGQLSVRFH